MTIKSIIKRIFGLADREEVELLQQKVQDLEVQMTKKSADEKTKIDNLTSEVETTNKRLTEKESSSKKIIEAKDAELKEKDTRIANLTSQLNTLQPIIELRDKIESIRQQNSKGEEKRGRGRPPKGRVDYHLKMDADLQLMEKVVKPVIRHNPQDVINELYRDWLTPQYEEVVKALEAKGGSDVPTDEMG